MRIFYVYQGDSYVLECHGEYVWSPKLAKNGSKNAGFSMMKEVSMGDLIFHHCKGEIKAISVAQSNCIDCAMPEELNQFTKKWNNDGYIINTAYKEFTFPFRFTEENRNGLRVNYTANSAFTKEGLGKQQYMCALNKKHALYLIEEVSKKLKPEEESIKNILENAKNIIKDKP
ncbi:hypothetical protein [Rodentibacter pneumotropicus]|uniref:EVE domain-containing protein n=1 Tax=Rodentibacter pneumotropicus TaxID=758 RepID=A0A4S2Q2P0_9PAST|nr:hypothetical protein [Rodentibacter pneumotropicus]THA10344.1 hypothetical protein D3M78_03525 [Rodentibacter pneumotropicus]